MKNDEKITTNFEPSNEEDVLNKVYLDKKISQIEGQISFTEKNYMELLMHSNKKQSEEEPLIERAVKATIQMFYDKGLLDNYDNVDESLKDYLLIERRRLKLEERDDDDIQ